MRYATANIRYTPPMLQPKVLSDVKEVGTFSDVIGWQEIHDDRYLDAIRSLKDFRHLGTKGSHQNRMGGCPISWRGDKWTRLDNGLVFLHDGRPDVCRDKYMTWVLLSRVGDPARQVVVTNRHYVSLRGEHEGWRRAQWGKGNLIDRNAVSGFVKRGIPVVGLGDFNSRSAVMGEVMHGRRVRYLIEEIDQIWVIAGAHYTWRSSHPDALALHSDHDARTVNASLVPR